MEEDKFGPGWDGIIHSKEEQEEYFVYLATHKALVSHKVQIDEEEYKRLLNQKEALYRMNPFERYSKDHEFALLVDSLLDMIINCRFSPTELRDALMLATIKYEERYANPQYKIVSGPDGERIEPNPDFWLRKR